MPLETSPRSLPFSIFTPPGRVDLWRAAGTRSPTWTFQAPVTIWMGSDWPTSIWQIHMWSELGWRSMERTRPTTTLEISAPRSVVISTLEPERVMASAKSRSPASTVTNSLSHLRDRFIYENSLIDIVGAAWCRPVRGRGPETQNCSRKRTSFSKMRRRSAILKRRMAVRSRPMPKAQPE